MTYKRQLLPPPLALLLSVALAAPVMADDAGMKRSLAAARAQQWSDVERSAVEGHPLAGYVEYHELKARLPEASPAEVNDYLSRYENSALSGWMRGVAQSAWGARQRFDALLAISDGPPDTTERQCWYYRALLDRDPERAARGGRALWLSERSQPTACDPLFDRLRDSQAIDGGDIWARLMLAWRAGESGLVNYLLPALPAAFEPVKAAFETLRSDPARVAELPGRGIDDADGVSLLYRHAMALLTRQNTEGALDVWQRIEAQAPLGDEQRHAIEHDLVFYSLVRDVNANATWADDATRRLGDQDLLELRTRKALEARHWPQVVAWIERMDAEDRADAHWQYWLGRAREQLGDPEGARRAWQNAADERSFFGFAAADRLDRPYALENRNVAVAPATLEDVGALPMMQRVAALYRIDEPGLARAEWYHLIERAPQAQRPALLQYALTQQWFDLAIFGAIQNDYWNVLAWRFPQAYAPLFQQWSATHDVDPWLLMAISRRESSFNPEAQSPVGARGLMQLMPGTGEFVSRQQGLDWTGVESLEDPALNVRLGSAYFRDMAARYSGNRLAAAAAYNAGPGRVDRWLAGSDEPFDLFVEEIPFRETREYVKAVLTYRVIFESLARGTTEGVSLLSETERQIRYSDALRR